MSSMRNAVQRRNHKERAQPHQREKWGILEKHKDYSLRAKDYNEKKRRLKILRQKAAARNPDEFHFAMMRSKTQDGGLRIASRSSEVLSQDVAKLLKTQDAGYLRTMAQKTRMELERLEQNFWIGGNTSQAGEQLTLLNVNANSASEHIIFVDDVVKQQQYGGASQVLDSKQTFASNDLKEARVLRNQRKREQQGRQSRLEALKRREKDFLKTERLLEIQRAQMSNNMGGVNKEGVKFKVRERKR